MLNLCTVFMNINYGNCMYEMHAYATPELHLWYNKKMQFPIIYLPRCFTSFIIGNGVVNFLWHMTYSFFITFKNILKDLMMQEGMKDDRGLSFTFAVVF